MEKTGGEKDGETIRYYRLKNGLTKPQLASRIGVHPSTITRYENNDRLHALYVARKLTDALDVKLTDLMAARNSAQRCVFNEFHYDY